MAMSNLFQIRMTFNGSLDDIQIKLNSFRKKRREIDEKLLNFEINYLKLIAMKN